MSTGKGMNGTILSALKLFFTEDDWTYSQLSESPILQMGFSGANGSWRCYAQAREEKEQFVYYSVMESRVPETKRLEIAEFLTRANFGLIVGNFEMDFSDGEVRYKTSLDIEGGTLSNTMIKNLVYTNVLMMDRYLPGIMAVIYGDVAPEDAIRNIEG